MMTRFLFFCLFLFPVYLSAQSYLNTTSQWRFRGGASDFDGNGYIFDQTFYLDGDTSISGNTYFKLYFDRQDTTISWANHTITGFDTTPHTYRGAIREESKKFYMVYFYNMDEELILDFNLQLGDTTHWDACYLPVTVTKVDTVFLGPTPLKRFFLNGFNNEFVLEGVCATTGFQLSCPGTIGIEYNLNPVCYGRDGYTVPLMAGNATCSLGTSTTSMPSSRQLLLYPSPSNGLVHLSLPALPAVSQVFNARGEEVLRKNHQNEEPILDLSKLPNGLYFLRVRQASTTYLGKVLLIK